MGASLRLERLQLADRESSARSFGRSAPPNTPMLQRSNTPLLHHSTPPRLSSTLPRLASSNDRETLARLGRQRAERGSLRRVSSFHFLPPLKEIDGYHGVSVLRRNVGDEIEFVTITRFSSVDAIRRFAGDDYEAAHVAPRAKELLKHFDARCLHLDLVIEQ